MAKITEENKRENVEMKNETKGSLLRFEASRIFTDEWPSDKNKAMQALELQLKFAGGFCTQMEIISLDTPPNVRLDISGVLNSLRFKINHPTPQPITSVESFTIPNMGKLISSDQVMNAVESFCNALGTCDKPTTVNTLILPCDKVSTEFHSGNLDWIDQFCTRHDVKRISITVSQQNVNYYSI